MLENLKQYRCGHCGEDKYHLYKQEDNNLDIFVECINCKNISQITVTPPELDIKWPSDYDSEGIIYT